VTRQKNTDVIYFQTGVVDPALQPKKDVWMVAVMPHETLVFDQRDNEYESSPSPVFPVVTLEQHRASLREELPGLPIGTPLFPEIRIPVHTIPRDPRYVQVNPVLDKHEYLSPWWSAIDQKYDAPPATADNRNILSQANYGPPRLCERERAEVRRNNFKKSVEMYVVKWTRRGDWYQYDSNSKKYRAMTLNDKVRAASSGGLVPYYINNILLRRLIADIAFA